MSVSIELLNCLAEDLIGVTADVMICDPPYRPHVHSNAVSQSAKGGARKRDLGFGCLSDDLRQLIASFTGQLQVKRWSLIYSDVESLHDWRQSCTGFGSQYIRVIPWVRWSMPQLTGTMPPQGWEAVNVFHNSKGKKHWNGRGNLLTLEHDPEIEAPDVVLNHKCLRGEGKNKAEKPLDQLLDLVCWFSDPGETVIDLTAGRGTTAVACALLGRNFIGAEMREDECALAQERIDLALRGKLSDRDGERFLRWSESIFNEDTSSFTAPSQARAAKRTVDFEYARELCGL